MKPTKPKPSHPTLIAVICGLFAMLPLGFVWAYGMLLIAFSPGNHSYPSDGPNAWYIAPAVIAISLAVMFVDGLSVVIAYKLTALNRAQCGTEHISIPKKVWLIAAFLPLLPFLLLLGYNYYTLHRTGSLNPYTQTCIQAGYRGARGDVCY